MKEKMLIINNMIEACQAHITGFKLGAFKEARALLNNVWRNPGVHTTPSRAPSVGVIVWSSRGT